MKLKIADSKAFNEHASAIDCSGGAESCFKCARIHASCIVSVMMLMNILQVFTLNPSADSSCDAAELYRSSCNCHPNECAVYISGDVAGNI